MYQPAWSPQGVLHLVCDRNGWWNLYRWRDGALQPVYEAEAEVAHPQWQLGTATYGFDRGGHIVCSCRDAVRWRLLRIDAAGEVRVQASCAYLESIADLAVRGDTCVLLGGAPDRPASVLRVDLARDETTTLRQSFPLAFDPAHLSIPRALDFPTGEGERAHAFFYPPANADCEAPEGEAPPLIVVSHGGPTGATSTTLDLRIQFWTSRGFAVLDVDYRGSTGYGRAYRDRLAGAWGLADVEDCVNGALHLAAEGRVDRERLAIRGGSAGGFTTLCALVFHDVFKAGASFYGISDLEALARDTHKFESRYLDRLIGPWPEEAERYRRRSPIHAAERLSCPVIFFQGLEDKVVPPNQAERMVSGAARAGAAGGPTSPSRGNSTASGGPRPSRPPSRPSSASTAGSSASGRPESCRRSRSRTFESTRWRGCASDRRDLRRSQRCSSEAAGGHAARSLEPSIHETRL